MLAVDTKMKVESPFATPAAICHKNKSVVDPEVWRFAIDLRKVNVITQSAQFPIPVIDDILPNIYSINCMPTFVSTSGYFQIAMKPKYISKTDFITNSCCLT